MCGITSNTGYWKYLAVIPGHGVVAHLGNAGGGGQLGGAGAGEIRLLLQGVRGRVGLLALLFERPELGPTPPESPSAPRPPSAGRAPP